MTLVCNYMMIFAASSSLFFRQNLGEARIQTFPNNMGMAEMLPRKIL